MILSRSTTVYIRTNGSDLMVRSGSITNRQNGWAQLTGDRWISLDWVD